MPEGWAIQRHPGKPEKWFCKNPMKFTKAKCMKALHMGQGNPKHK